MSKFVIFILCVSSFCHADEVLNLRGTLAVGNCKVDRQPKCILLNSDRVPFDLVLKPSGEELEGSHEFRTSAETHNFLARIIVIKYKDFRGEYHYNFDIFVDSWIEGNESTFERNYLGYFDIKHMNHFSDLGLWGQRRGKENNWFAPHVIIGADN